MNSAKEKKYVEVNEKEAPDFQTNEKCTVERLHWARQQLEMMTISLQARAARVGAGEAALAEAQERWKSQAQGFVQSEVRGLEELYWEKVNKFNKTIDKTQLMITAIQNQLKKQHEEMEQLKHRLEETERENKRLQRQMKIKTWKRSNGTECIEKTRSAPESISISTKMIVHTPQFFDMEGNTSRVNTQPSEDVKSSTKALKQESPSPSPKGIPRFLDALAQAPCEPEVEKLVFDLVRLVGRGLRDKHLSLRDLDVNIFSLLPGLYFLLVRSVSRQGCVEQESFFELLWEISRHCSSSPGKVRQAWFPMATSPSDKQNVTPVFSPSREESGAATEPKNPSAPPTALQYRFLHERIPRVLVDLPRGNKSKASGSRGRHAFLDSENAKVATYSGLLVVKLSNDQEHVVKALKKLKDGAMCQEVKEVLLSRGALRLIYPLVISKIAAIAENASSLLLKLAQEGDHLPMVLEALATSDFLQFSAECCQRFSGGRGQLAALEVIVLLLQRLSRQRKHVKQCSKSKGLVKGLEVLLQKQRELKQAHWMKGNATPDKTPSLRVGLHQIDSDSSDEAKPVINSNNRSPDVPTAEDFLVLNICSTLKNINKKK